MRSGWYEPFCADMLIRMVNIRKIASSAIVVYGLAVPTWLAFLKQPVEAGLLMAGACVFIALINLDQFETFKTSWFEAKTREVKDSVEENRRISAQIRVMSEGLIKSLVAALPEHPSDSGRAAQVRHLIDVSQIVNSLNVSDEVKSDAATRIRDQLELIYRRLDSIGITWEFIRHTPSLKEIDIEIKAFRFDSALEKLGLTRPEEDAETRKTFTPILEDIVAADKMIREHLRKPY